MKNIRLENSAEKMEGKSQIHYSTVLRKNEPRAHFI